MKVEVDVLGFLDDYGIPNSPYRLCRRQTTLNLDLKTSDLRSSPSLIGYSPYGLCGRQAKLNSPKKIQYQKGRLFILARIKLAPWTRGPGFFVVCWVH